MGTVTAYDNPDWESQMHQMLGADAPDMIKRFGRILEGFIPLDEPVAICEVAFSRNEIYTTLPAMVEWLESDPEAPESVRQALFDLGVDLCRQYITDDNIEFDEDCTATIPYFFGDDDDE